MRTSTFSSFKCFAKGFAVWLLFVFNLILSFPVQAQDASNFTQFFLNPYLLNASYAGFDGQLSVSLLYRRQWMTIEGAPTITNLGVQAPINARVSAGMNITNDSKGFYNNSALLFSMAYHVPIQDHTFLRFGISAGGSWNTVDMKKLEAINDPALASVLDKNGSLAGNAGISLHHKLFNFGIAMPTLFAPAYVSEDAFTVKEVKPFQALILHGSNRFYFNNNKNIFEPYAVYRINTGLPAQYEIAGVLHLNHVVWAGVSHKQDFGLSGLGGIKLKNMLAIGASYSIQKSGADELNSPSFEVILNYLFGPRKKGAPVYSFVNAVKVKEKTQTTAVRQALDARRKKAEEDQKEKAEAAAKLKQEKLEKQKRLDAQAKAKQESAAKSHLESQAKFKQDAELKQRQEQERIKLEEAEKQKRADAVEAARLAAQKRKNEENSAREKAELEKRELEGLSRQNTEAKAEQEANARRIREEQEKVKLEEAEKQKREESARLADQKRLDQQNAARENAERQKQEQEALAKKNAEVHAEKEANARRIQEEQQKAQAEEAKRIAEDALVAQQQQAISDAAGVSEGHPQHEQEQLQRLVIHSQDPNRTVEDTARTGKPIRHEVVKRGNHAEELLPSEYVVVGVFKSRENANHFSNGLRNLDFRTNLGYLTEKNLWYVYLLKTNNIERARAEQARVSKMFLLRDAFLLTVNAE